MSTLPDLSIAELGAGLQTAQFKARDILEAHLDRIEALDGRLNAFIQVTADEARAQADAADAEIAAGSYRGPLHGIPLGIKDIIDQKGVATTCHSRICLNDIAGEDAHVTGLLRAAGAVFAGKLATHEFAIGGPQFDGPFPPARNPWNPARHPGGSSSGSGSAVAARMVAGALGTDTGGSVRNPASACGIVGLKPTYGLVSRRGVFPLSWTLDHVGPMTRTVRDAALMLNVMAGADPGDAGSAMRPAEDYTRELGAGVRGLRVGYLKRFHTVDQPADPRMAAAIEEAAELLRSLGAIVTEVELPQLPEFRAVNRAIIGSESAAIHENWLRDRPQDYAAITRRRLLPGMFFRAVDYTQALRRRSEMKAQVEALFEGCDVLLSASSMDPACAIDDPDLIEHTYARQARTPFNVTGHPALTLMAGVAAPDNVPLSVQLVAPYFAETRLLRVAAAYEAATPWHKMTPAFVAGALRAR